MITVKQGNILDANEDIICQQVNCKNVMGAGLALQIKSKYPEVERAYHEICAIYKPNKLLGYAQMITCHDGKNIVNIFGQLNYGRDKQYTDYEALWSGLDSVFTSVATVGKYKGKTVAIPYGIGCGLAGADWSVVYQMLVELTTHYDYDVTIYQL